VSQVLPYLAVHVPDEVGRVTVTPRQVSMFVTRRASVSDHGPPWWAPTLCGACCGGCGAKGFVATAREVVRLRAALSGGRL